MSHSGRSGSSTSSSSSSRSSGSSVRGRSAAVDSARSYMKSAIHGQSQPQPQPQPQSSPSPIISWVSLNPYSSNSVGRTIRGEPRTTTFAPGEADVEEQQGPGFLSSSSFPPPPPSQPTPNVPHTEQVIQLNSELRQSLELVVEEKLALITSEIKAQETIVALQEQVRQLTLENENQKARAEKLNTTTTSSSSSCSSREGLCARCGGPLSHSVTVEQLIKEQQGLILYQRGLIKDKEEENRHLTDLVAVLQEQIAVVRQSIVCPGCVCKSCRSQ